MTESDLISATNPPKRAWRAWAGAVALTLLAPIAAGGLATGCYAWGRMEVAAMRAADPLGTARHGVPLPWQDGLWSVHLFMSAFMIAWLATIAVMAFRAAKPTDWIRAGIPLGVFVLLGVETLRMAYTCNIF